MMKPQYRRLTVRIVILASILIQPKIAGQLSQLPVISSQQQYSNGQGVVPLYRGWFRGPNGERYVTFEYLNRNSEEIIQIPVGPNNKITPGPLDQGQPTYFLPGHQHGVFTVLTPKTSAQEISWTLNIRDTTFTMPANLDPLYEIEGLINRGGSFPGNTPPKATLTPDEQMSQGPAGHTSFLTIDTSEQLLLKLLVTDDGLPPRPEGNKVIRSLQQSYRRGDASVEGVTVTWNKYRGPGPIFFDNQSPIVRDGQALTRVRFDTPGDYMLHALVSDGSGFDGCCWTNSYVKVTVETPK